MKMCFVYWNTDADIKSYTTLKSLTLVVAQNTKRESSLIICSVANYTEGVDPVDSTKGTEI